MAASNVRGVTGHVKINAVEVVNTQGKAAFTANTGKGISRYSLSCSGLCIFRLLQHCSRDGPEYFACTIVTYFKGQTRSNGVKLSVWKFAPAHFLLPRFLEIWNVT
jgi:hypothetical protein